MSWNGQSQGFNTLLFELVFSLLNNFDFASVVAMVQGGHDIEIR